MILFNRTSPWWTISSEVQTHDMRIEEMNKRIVITQNAMNRLCWYKQRYEEQRVIAFNEMVRKQTWEDDGGPAW